MLQNSSPQEDSLQLLMEAKKRKRMLSNRESARRSRMRKQQQFDDLIAQVSQLRHENDQILAKTQALAQHYLNVETENTILGAQVAELTHRLNSLNEVIDFISTTTSGSQAFQPSFHFEEISNRMLSDVWFGDPLDSVH